MEELNQVVGLIADIELIRATKEHGKTFSSEHQGYGVILEEIQEAEEELERVKHKLCAVWGAIRRNEYPMESIEMLCLHAKLMAAEAIQVAAMAQKYINSFKED